MTAKIFIDTQFGGAKGRDPISVGLVGEDARLLYIEATDVTIGPFDVLSKFQRTVGAKFVPMASVRDEVAAWIKESARQDGVTLICSTVAVKKYWANELAESQSSLRLSGLAVELTVGRPEDGIREKILGLCAGAGNCHALMEALAIAVSHKGGGLTAAVDATKFGLLIGAKNALSLRAYLRRMLEARPAAAA
jgi:hypothetical protein